MAKTDLVLQFFGPWDVGERPSWECIFDLDGDHEYGYLQKRWIINLPFEVFINPARGWSRCPDHSYPSI